MSVLHMSVSAGVLVIAVVLIRAVALNWLPKKMFLALWGVALIRLLAPISIPLPLRVPGIIDEVSKAVLSATAPPVIGNPANTGEAAGQLAEAAREQFFSIAPATAIWLAGMLAAFFFFAVICCRNHGRLRCATAIRDNDFLNEWLAGHRLLRPVAIMQSDRIISPLAVGIIKPRIILPKSLNMSDEQLLGYVLTHEYFHIKRHDAVWKMLLLLALCVHWFNPMVWVMFVLASRDLELTCDEAVIYRFGAKTKKTYACMLISIAEQQGKFAPLYNGFSRNAAEERIESIMKMGKTPILALIAAIVIVAGAATMTIAASATSPEDTKLTAGEQAAYGIHDVENDATVINGGLEDGNTTRMMWVEKFKTAEYGQFTFEAGQKVTIQVTERCGQEMVVWLHSVSPHTDYSQVIKNGTGTVTFEIPSTGEYSFYFGATNYKVGDLMFTFEWSVNADLPVTSIEGTSQ